jgi:DNA-binding Lrp family transcriptional regulator
MPLIRLGCTPDAAEQLARALARRPDTSHVSLISGGTEVLCAMKPRSRQERDELLLTHLQRTPRVTSVRAYCLPRRFYGGPLDWLGKINALDPDQEAALRPPAVAPPSEPVVLDDADYALLSVLRQDGRTKLTELQATTGLSESSVNRRLEHLRTTGVLYLGVQYEHERLGHGIGATLWLTVAPAALANVGRALAAHPEVSFAGATTGQANVFAATLHRSTDDLYAYLSDKIGALDGVQSVETALTLRQVKALTYEPGH